MIQTNPCPSSALLSGLRGRPPLVATSPPRDLVLDACLDWIERLSAELWTHPQVLLTLNPSRRNALSLRLQCALDEVPTSSVTPPLRKNDPKPKVLPGCDGWLRQLVSNDQQRTPAQDLVLRSYFQEVAFITLGQALVLKRWADLKLCGWVGEDLGRLNWSLSSRLKPLVPPDRESWVITRPNLFSWYHPPLPLQRELSRELARLPLDQSRVTLLTHAWRMFCSSQGSHGWRNPLPLPDGFMKAWTGALENPPERPEDSKSKSSTIPPLSILRKTAFTPTLRDGSALRELAPQWECHALEGSLFHLLLSELTELWDGPTSPPLWAEGTGLEVHPRDQLILKANTLKHSVVDRLTEREAYDLAWVNEEVCVRWSQKTLRVLELRELLENLPYFRKLRGPTVSLGALQACVALAKLRPGAFLGWARNEPLGPREGAEVLSFLFDRSTLLGEWDFSMGQAAADTPCLRYFYLFQREPNPEVRHGHRPARYQLPPHAPETALPIGFAFYRQAFDLLWQDRTASTPLPPHLHRPTVPLLWQKQISPIPQSEWSNHWPDPCCPQLLHRLESLRAQSVPLAAISTVRTQQESDLKDPQEWTDPLPERGFFIPFENKKHPSRLFLRPLPHPHQDHSGMGIRVLFNDPEVIGPIWAYLESEIVSQWLDQHAERRNGRWIIQESLIKWIPIPLALNAGLKEHAHRFPTDGQSESTGLTTLQRDLLASLTSVGSFERPSGSSTQLKEQLLRHTTRLRSLPHPSGTLRLPLRNHDRAFHIEVFIRAARLAETIRSVKNPYSMALGKEGEMSWTKLLRILPSQEKIPLTLHPEIRIEGSLPPYLPLNKIEKLKLAVPTFLLATESGYSLRVLVSNLILAQMIWEPLSVLKNATWSEIIRAITVPRDIAFIQQTASAIVQEQAQRRHRLEELRELLDCCFIDS